MRTGEGPSRIGGYAAKFNTLSQNLGGFVERINPGFFDKSLADGADVLARYQHMDEYLLGRVSSGTLQLTRDGIGLDYTVDLPDTGYARDIAALAARGDLRHSSFAFRVFEDEWSLTADDFPLRTLITGALVDVAPVVTPAYMDTSSGLRSLAESRGMTIAAVTEAVEGNRLAELFRTKTIIDLAARGQGETHPLMAIRKRRAELYRRTL